MRLLSMLKKLLPFMLLTACIHSRAIPVGEPHAIRFSPDEPITYERMSLASASQKYTQVGVMCVTARYERIYQVEDDRLHRHIRDRALALGGDTVSVIGLCSIGRHAGVEIGVFTARS